jgi:hypothetical protein
MRNNYWTCSKFADWLRGTMKPTAETSEGWHKWNKQAKKSHPFRYWLAEEGLDIIQKTIFYPVDKLYALKYYINNRFVTRTHSLTAHARDISPGSWCDVGNRFLPCLFNELVDFVEIELAWWHVAWDKDAREKFVAPWWAWGWFRWRTWRNPECGLANLDWQRKLVWNEDELLDESDERYGKPTSQAIKAQEILDLYTWWTVERPKRVDPHTASGWSAYCDERRADRDEDGEPYGFMGREEKTTEEKERVSKMLDECHKIEQAYETEDEEMMIRLIKVRHGLWT